MKRFLVLVFLALLTSCGKQNNSHSNPQSKCEIKINANDIPAIIAVKAFQLQTDCSIKNEQELVELLSGV